MAAPGTNFPKLPLTGGTVRDNVLVTNNCVDGKTNNVAEVTLAAGTTTTTLTDHRIGANSCVSLAEAKSLNAAAAWPTTYVSAKADGSATFTHANNGQTDRTFGVVITG